MPTTSYKLIYFNSRGIAEPIRYLFVEAGVEFEDVRLSGEEFEKMRASLPAGTVPVLEVDGQYLAGSGVIARYLAEKFGLAGTSDWENAQLASIVDVVNDLYGCFVPVYWGGDEASKAAAKKKLLAESIPRYCGILEKRVRANNSADGWAYGNKMTYVDTRLSVMVDALKNVDTVVIDAYPVLQKLTEAVKARPKIAEWIKNRPVTEF